MNNDTLYNKQHISLREAKVFLNGVEVMNAVSANITVTPETAQSVTLGEQMPSTRWLGMKATGTITQYKATPWLKEMISEYMRSGATPEFVIQGRTEDKASEYYKAYGSDTVTASGCVVTSDITLFASDRNGELVQETVNFNVKQLT